jgi:hypothetical protein
VGRMRKILMVIGVIFLFLGGIISIIGSVNTNSAETEYFEISRNINKQILKDEIDEEKIKKYFNDAEETMDSMPFWKGIIELGQFFVYLGLVLCFVSLLFSKKKYYLQDYQYNQY